MRASKSATAAIVYFLLVQPCSALAQSQVSFPKTEKPVGNALLYKEGTKDLKLIGPATGSVTVPTGLKLYVIATPEGMEYFDALRQLKPGSLSRLRLHDVPISASNIQTITKMKGLNILDFSYTDMNDKTFSKLNGPSTLANMDLSRTLVKNLEGNSLRGLPNLIDIDFSNSALNDAGVANLVKACPQLKFLNLTGTHVTDECFLSLQKLQQLIKLKIKRTAVTGKHFDKLVNIKPLVKISLAGTHLQKQYVQQFRKAKPNCRLAIDDPEF